GDDADDGRDEAEPLQAVAEELAGCEVVVVNTQSGEMLRPFRDFRTSFLPAWSPDGRFLALLCQDGERRYPRLTLWEKGQGEPRVFEAAPMSPVTGFLALRWTRDSGRLIFKVKDLPDASPLVQRQTTEETGVEANSRESLGVLDVRTGQVQVWGEMTRACGWRLSPDERRVAFARFVKSPLAARHNQASYVQLVAVNLDDGEELPLGEPQTDNWGASFSWSPDGSAIAWVCAAHQSETQLFVAELGSPQRLCAIALPTGTEFGWFDVGSYPAPAPRWNSQSSQFTLPGKGRLWRFTRDGQVLDAIALPEEKAYDWFCNSVTALDFSPCPPTALSVSENEDVEKDEVWLLRPDEVWKVDLATEAVGLIWKKKPEVPRISSYWTERAFDAATQQFYTVRSAPEGAVTLWATQLPIGQSRRVAVLLEGGGATRYGAIHHLSWTLPDGTSCGGSLLLPVNWKEGDKPPVVMNVYGDDRNNGKLSEAHFHVAGAVVDLHLLSANGYAAFVPDLPQTDEHPAGSLVVAGEAAVEALRESGLVDAERIVVIGNSYGGYTVLCLLIGSKLFRAGVASNGVYDLAFSATNEGWGWAESGQGRMRATLWEDPHRYIENSPLYALDKLEAPLLILRGGGDRCVDNSAKPLFASLQRLGKRGELLTYRDAGHAPISWSIAAQRDLHGRLLTFLQEHLR
ncbi:MAG: prolyl oligopeptidase family serine peptidase, partial [Armatimonadetes bacterium]|nr:prolyl oligopeptidase family serine peptidase [Armatimonadota bacterium]